MCGVSWVTGMGSRPRGFRGLTTQSFLTTRATAAHDPESEGKYCTLSYSRQKKPIPLPSVELDSCTFLYRAPSVAAVSKVRTFGSEVSPYRG